MITAPPAGAGPFNVTVAVVLAPPVTLAALNESDETFGNTVNKYGPELCVANWFAESTKLAVMMCVPTARLLVGGSVAVPPLTGAMPSVDCTWA